MTIVFCETELNINDEDIQKLHKNELSTIKHKNQWIIL